MLDSHCHKYKLNDIIDIREFKEDLRAEVNVLSAETDEVCADERVLLCLLDIRDYLKGYILNLREDLLESLLVDPLPSPLLGTEFGRVDVRAELCLFVLSYGEFNQFIQILLSTEGGWEESKSTSNEGKGIFEYLLICRIHVDGLDHYFPHCIECINEDFHHLMRDLCFNVFIRFE
jgi:hypothetical protein